MLDFGYNVILDTIRPERAELLRSWRNDFRIRRWCRQNDLISQARQNEWINRQAMDPSISMYEIISSQQKVVGICGLTSIDHLNRRAEFSLYIQPEEQGKGHAKAALRTLLTHGFDNLGLNSIWGETFDGNNALILFKKLGFQVEGTRRQFYFKQGKFIDAHLVSILSSEFKCSTPDLSLVS